MTCFSVLLFVFVLCNKLLISNAVDRDTISEGQSLSGSIDSLISKNGNFRMGFFAPGKSANYYVGIWYNDFDFRFSGEQTIVWVANRDNPVSTAETGGLAYELNFETVNLVFYNNVPSHSIIWSTELPSSAPNTTEAVLRDDGNLVIRYKFKPSVVIWQSFDHPTHTWLPGQKIGFNAFPLLTSWRNQENPARGIFNLEFSAVENNQYLIITRVNEREIWRSAWNVQAKTFTFFPNMRSNSISSFSYISNENESFVTYSVYDNSILTRFVLDVSGQIKQFTWSNTRKKWNLVWSQPKDQYDVYGICGISGICNQYTQKSECLPGFVARSLSDWNLRDSTSGCRTPSKCGSKSKDVFSLNKTLILSGDLPVREEHNSTTEQCKSACQSSCYCNAYAYGNTTGCQLWEGDMLSTKNQSSGKAWNFYPRLAVRGIPIKNHRKEVSGKIPVKKRKPIIWKILVPVIVSLAAIIMGVVGYIYLCKRNKANERGSLIELQGVLTDLLKNKGTYNDTPNTNMLSDRNSEGETHELQIFDLVCLTTATNNFCLKNKLGEGGFGPVYKGKLQNGQQIAVKRLSKSSGQGIEEFKNEVVLIPKLQHRNLVKLLGCCIEGEENMLIYEYMPNKSLDAFLFDPRNKVCLGWGKRYNIIGGIARGLLYLHRDSRVRVIHRDLKVSNILLDEEMIPKIADFGMARMFVGNQTSDNTSRVVGTMGYMSPEYMIGGTFSEKSDVFSFGVLVLEVVSGKRNSSFYDPDQPLNLLLHAWRLWNEGKWPEIVDEALGDMYSPSEVMKCIHVGLLCGQNRSVDRPTMAEVDFMFNYETDRPSPKEPPYTFPASSENHGVSPIHSSNNNVTLTTIGGR